MRGEGGERQAEMPRGWGERANSRNQDDKRRVGAVMHDAQIRAIIPITVQIIVREPTRRAASAQTQPAQRPCSVRTTTIRIRVDIGPARLNGLGERCDFELEIAELPKRLYTILLYATTSRSVRG